jgi:GTPase SAR1 family protein
MKLRDILNNLRRASLKPSSNDIPQWLEDLQEHERHSLLAQLIHIQNFVDYIIDDEIEAVHLVSLIAFNQYIDSINIKEQELKTYSSNLPNTPQEEASEASQLDDKGSNNSIALPIEQKPTSEKPPEQQVTVNKSVKKYDFQYKILLIGNYDAGKPALIRSFEDSPHSFITSIGMDFKIRECTYSHDNKLQNGKFQIWDTAGQERFKNITTSYYKSANFIALCVSLDENDGVIKGDIEDWYRSIPSNLPIFLIGTTNEPSKSHSFFIDYFASHSESFIGGAITDISQKKAQTIQSFGPGVRDYQNAKINSSLEESALLVVLNCCYHHHYKIRPQPLLRVPNNRSLSSSFPTISITSNWGATIWRNSQPQPASPVFSLHKRLTQDGTLTREIKSLDEGTYNSLLAPLKRKIQQFESQSSLSQLEASKLLLLTVVKATLDLLRSNNPSMKLTINNWDALANHILVASRLQDKNKRDKVLNGDTGRLLGDLKKALVDVTPQLKQGAETKLK